MLRETPVLIIVRDFYLCGLQGSRMGCFWLLASTSQVLSLLKGS